MRAERCISVLIILLISLIYLGCASPISNLNELRKIKNDIASLKNEEDFDKNKLIYNKNIRAFEYGGKVLLKETGEKIKDEENAIEMLNSLYTDEFITTKDKIIFGVSIAYAIPVTLYFIIDRAVLWVAELPLYPAGYYFYNKGRKLSFTYYKKGEELLGKEEFEKSRIYFMKSIAIKRNIIQDSDIYYHIAKTFEMEEDKESELKYYRLFLNYSVRQYPEFFYKKDKSYVNDFEKLNLLFNEAEYKINEKSAN